jgi:A/G-specific adenine glycosylase
MTKGNKARPTTLARLPAGFASRLHAPLLSWFSETQSLRNLPWRATRDPYAIWVSETMLQQTRVQTVIPYWERFLRELPTVQALAEAPLGKVLSLWSGLGYYRRARMLHAAAGRVVTDYGGALPEDPELLRRLEGVGAYTAGAVASIAFGRSVPALDGNVTRVLARLFGVRDDVSKGEGRRRLSAIAEEVMPRGKGASGASQGDPGAWNQALMELGATVCTPRNPTCTACPVREPCTARALGLETKIPRVARKKPAPRIEMNALVIEVGQRVLLARRKESGLFGGLWEPPCAEGEVATLAESVGVRASAFEAAGEVVHVLTHRVFVVAVWSAHLRSRPACRPPGDEYDAVDWVEIGPRGLPSDGRPHATLARKIVTSARQLGGWRRRTTPL